MPGRGAGDTRVVTLASSVAPAPRALSCVDGRVEAEDGGGTRSSPWRLRASGVQAVSNSLSRGGEGAEAALPSAWALIRGRPVAARPIGVDQVLGKGASAGGRSAGPTPRCRSRCGRIRLWTLTSWREHRAGAPGGGVRHPRFPKVPGSGSFSALRRVRRSVRARRCDRGRR